MNSGELGPAAKVARAFLTPARRAPSPCQEFLFSGEAIWIDGPVGKLAVYRSGEGPAVVFVHGWEGQVGDFASLIRSCVHAGFQAIALDLPGHGASEGSTVSIPICAESLLSAQQALGGFHAVVGHSVGSVVAVQAATLGFRAKRMVLISTPARYEHCARIFCTRAGLNSEQTEEMIEMLEAMGTNVRSISIPAIAERLQQEALFIHSYDDRVVPISEGRESANAWKRGGFLEVVGFGHTRILGASVVIETVLKFLGNGIEIS